MRKIQIIIFWLLTIPIGSVYAQDEQNRDVCSEINTLEKVGPWQVVKLTIAYMEDYKAENVGKLNEEEEKTLKELKSKYSTFKEGIDLDKVGNELVDGNWEKTKAKVFDKYKEVIILDANRVASHFRDGYINFEPSDVNNESREKAIKEIDKVFKSVYDEITNSKTESKQTANVSNIPDTENTELVVDKSSTTEKKGILDTYLKLSNPFLVTTILFLLIIVYLIFIKKSNKNKQKNDKHEPFYKSQVEALNKQIKELNDKIQKLKSEKPQNQKNDATPNQFNNSKESDKSYTDTVKNKEEKPNIVDLDPKTGFKTIYLPSPFDEKRFSNEDASESPTPTSLYVINYNTYSNKGVITIMDGANFDRAINSPNDYFEKVCYYDNPPDVNATRVDVTEKGDVELVGEDWVVTKKLRIKFI